jgi:tetratricopeptide (TPR) repeat protein
MKRVAYRLAFAGLAFALLIAGLAPRAAAQDSGVTGTVLDLNAKPWPDLKVTITSDQGSKLDATTDKNGKYEFHNLRSGTYQISVQLPNQLFQGGNAKLGSGQTITVDFNFKEIMEKQDPTFAEKMKKQTEEKQKFQGMKQHFDTGVATLEQARQAKADLAKAPADQRDALKQNVTDLTTKAVTELEAAKAALPEKDNNRPTVLAKLAQAYDEAGRTDDAIATYKQAIDIKPSPDYYNNLGGVFGRAGKIEDATAAFQKSAELDPPHAAGAWLNYGIVLSNANRYKEAVEPLKKATDLDPKNPKGWYLLASAMIADPSIYKQTAGKIEVTPLPGTAEAYQKAIDLDPNGPWGKQAKEGLDQLNQMTGGINTQLGGGAKKKKP